MRSGWYTCTAAVLGVEADVVKDTWPCYCLQLIQQGFLVVLQHSIGSVAALCSEHQHDFMHGCMVPHSS